MRFFASKLGRRLACAYLALYCLSGVYPAGLHWLHRGNEWSGPGMLAILLTLPWSLLLAPLLKAAGWLTWYDHFPQHPLLYSLLALVPLAPGALCNAGILYWLGSLFTRINQKGQPAAKAGGPN